MAAMSVGVPAVCRCVFLPTQVHLGWGLSAAGRQKGADGQCQHCQVKEAWQWLNGRWPMAEGARVSRHGCLLRGRARGSTRTDCQRGADVCVCVWFLPPAQGARSS